MNEFTAFEQATREKRVKIDRAQEALNQMQAELNRQRAQLELECQHVHKGEHGACDACGASAIAQLFQHLGT